MAFRDELYYGAAAPAPTDEFIRTFWFVEADNDLYIWNETAGQYVLFLPDVTAPLPPDASETVKGILETATTSEVSAGTDDQRAVTPLKLAQRIVTLIDGAPTALDTLGKLSAALADDPDFALTIASALALKANASGSNVAQPTVSDADLSLANTLHVQNVIGDSAASNTDVDTARVSPTVTGATNSGGVNQKFTTLPALERYIGLSERTCTALAGGQSFTLQPENDIILLDGVNGSPTLLVGNPALFKRKVYRVICLNNVFPSFISFNPSWPTVDGPLTISLSLLGSVVTLVPLQNGTWAHT